MDNSWIVNSFIPKIISDWWNRDDSESMDHSSDEEKPLPPGSMGLPIVGETLEFLWKGSDFYAEKFRDHGCIYKTHILGSPVVRVTGASNVRSLIQREPDELNMKWPTSAIVMMGRKSLPTVVGPEHPVLKKHLQKAFTSVRLNDYIPYIQQHIQSSLQEWLKAGLEGKKILGHLSCEDLIENILLELVLGYCTEDDPDKNIKTAFGVIVNNLLAVPIKIPFGGFSKAVNARETISDFVKSKIAEVGNKKDHVNMMDVLLSPLNREGEIDEETVIDNVLGLLLAGATAAGAMTCLLLLLGKHSDVLGKIREELQAAGLTDGQAEISYSLLQQLKYVQCVVKEALRLLPPVGGCFRQTCKQLEFEGFRIPKDWTIIYSIRDTHKQTAEMIPDGNAFCPSRWQHKEQVNEQNETTSKSPPLDSTSCNYMPFGSGARICLGRHLAQMILHIFVIELALTADWTVINPECPLTYIPITKPKDNLPVIFRKH